MTGTKKARSTQTLDWSGCHSPVWAAISASGTAMSSSVVANLAGTAPGWAVAVGAVGAGAGPLLARARHRVTTLTASVQTTLWLGYGGWSAYAIAGSPWAPGSLAALAVGGVATYGLTHATGRHEVTEGARQAEAAILAGRIALAEEWSLRLKRVCRIDGAGIVAIEQWPPTADGTPTGYSVDVQLPYGGTDVDSVARYAKALAADLRLPDGCGVEPRPGPDRSRVVLHIATLDMFAVDLPFPAEITPLSINDDFDIGLHRDGIPALLHKREASTLLTGQKRSGKTNQLNVFLAQFARMTDCLVWVIDFNAGNLALPWIRPWMLAHAAGEGARVPNPVVDWVASTPEEAALMTEAALRIAKARKAGYQDRKRAANTDLLPIDDDLPEIVIVVDECAELLGQSAITRSRPGSVLRRAADALAEGQRIAGDSGVNYEICGLRATADIVADANIKKQSENKVGMRTPDFAELAYLFDGDYTLDPRDVPHKGCGFIKVGAAAPRPFKGYRILPQTMEDIAITTSPWQPPLDALSERAAGPAYTERWTWERYGHLFTEAAVTTTANAASRPSATATGGKADPTADWRARAESSIADLDIDARFREITDSLGSDDGSVDITDPRTWNSSTAADGDTDAIASSRDRMLDQLNAAGPKGMSAAELAAVLEVSRKTVYEHLGFHLEAGAIVKLARGRYALTEHQVSDGEEPGE